MKRFFKILLWSTLGLFTVFLLVISIVIIVLLANPNDYKPKISQFIQEQTGRTLTIAGDIYLSFFPWLGIELGKTTLGNATGFEEPIFASLENATVRLKLFPLLYKKFEVDTVFVNGMRLMLTRRPDGSTNWDDLVTLLNQSKTENTTESTQTEFNINGIEVTHSYFTWDDQLTNNRYEMADAHLRTAHFSLNQTFNTEFTSTINSYGKNPAQGRIAASALLTMSPTQQKIENLQLKTVLQSDNILAGKQPLTLQTKLDALINLSPLQTKLAIDSLLLQSLSSSGSIEITSGQITGEMKFAPFSPQTIAKEFNLPEPKLPNGKTFHQGQGSTRFYIDPQQGIKIEQLKFSLDNNQLFIPKAAIDLLNQTIDVENFSLQGFDSQIQGKVAIHHFLQQPNLQATVQLTNQNVSKLSPLLTSNLSLPSAIANQPLTLQTQLETDLTDLTLRNTQAKLGKNQLNLSDVQLNLPKQTFHIKDINASVQANLIEQLTQTKIPSAASFDTLQITTQLQGNKNEFNVEQLQIQAGKSHLTASKLKINLEKQIATLDSLIVDSLDVQLKANTLQINNLFIQPQWSGIIQFTPFNLRKLLDKLALTSIIPDTTDPHTLEKIALSTKFTGNSSKIHFTDTSLQIDKSQLTGYLQVNQFNKPEILFSFDIDKLDVDPYLPPKKEQPKETQPIELPIEMIRSLNINGQLNIGWLKMANVKMEQVNLQMTAKDGIVQFYPFNASLYGGKHEGNIALDAKNIPARLYIVETLSHIQAKSLLSDWIHKSPIVGTANVSAQLATDPVDILPTLFGSVSLEITDGNLAGINIGKTIRGIKSILENKPLPVDKEPLQTDFSNLNGTFLLNHGVVHNQNLALKSPLLRVQGKGDFILKSQEVNYHLTTSIVDTTKGQGGKELEELRGISIPLTLTGELDRLRLQINPDFLQTFLPNYLKSQAITELKKNQEKLLKPPTFTEPLIDPLKHFKDK